MTPWLRMATSIEVFTLLSTSTCFSYQLHYVMHQVAKIKFNVTGGVNDVSLESWLQFRGKLVGLTLSYKRLHIFLDFSRSNARQDFFIKLFITFFSAISCMTIRQGEGQNDKVLRLVSIFDVLRVQKVRIRINARIR